MKKVFTTAIIISILSLNFSFALDEFIFDEFAKNTLNSDLKITKTKYNPIIDEFAEDSLNQNLKIQKHVNELIIDNFASSLKNVEFVYYDKNQKFDFSKASIQKVKIRPVEYYTTRKNLYEGKYLDFELTQDVKLDNKIYKKGTSVKARVENITPNLAYGTPADIVLDNFILNNEIKLSGQIFQKGANRAIWIYPLAYTTSIFFGLGLFAYAIRGGHAKLKPGKIYELSVD